MRNIAITVEDEPSPAMLDEMEIDAPDTLFGIYQGTPLTERHWAEGNTLPDRIVLFQGPHEREAEDDDDLVASIAETLIHEIGHYFGLSEDEIQEIEERYWRGDPMEDEP
jgi:predicted Zn-dependent protease with MMP-like domain